MQADPVRSPKSLSTTHPAFPAPPSASANASPGLQPRATWDDLPEEVVHQLMAWLMQKDGAEDDIDRLAAASTGLQRSAEAFRDSAFYRGFRADREHRRSVGWTQEHLGMLGSDEASCLTVTDERSLAAMLTALPVWQAELATGLLIREEYARRGLTANWSQHFRDYRGPSLAVRIPLKPWESERVVEMARALPLNTCLDLRIDTVHANLPDAVKLMEKVASDGRMTGFSLLSGDASGINLAGLDKLMDVLCDPGRVQMLRFNSLDDASPLLLALAGRCSQLHALRLVTLVCEKVDDAALAALQEALLERQQQRKSRITVAIQCNAWLAQGNAGALASTETGRVELERAGLFSGRVSVPFDKALWSRLLASVAEGPPAEWRRPPEARSSEALPVARKKRTGCVIS